MAGGGKFWARKPGFDTDLANRVPKCAAEDVRENVVDYRKSRRRQKNDDDVGRTGALDLQKGPTPIGRMGGVCPGCEQIVNLEAGGGDIRSPIVNRRVISIC